MPLNTLYELQIKSISMSKKYVNKNFVTCKSLSNLQEFYSDHIILWCHLADWLKNYSLCVCSAHQNVVLLVDAMNWDEKDLMDLMDQ